MQAHINMWHTFFLISVMTLQGVFKILDNNAYFKVS